MKKLLIILLILALLLTACGRREVTSPIETPAETPEPTEEIVEMEYYDPGPPYVWAFYSMRDYYVLEEILATENDEALEEYANRKDFHFIDFDYNSLRENAEQVCKMVRGVSVVPQVEGYQYDFMHIIPEKDRLSVEFRLSGEGRIFVKFIIDEEKEKELIKNLGKRGHEAVKNPNVDKLYLTNVHENTDRPSVYYFGCLEDGSYMRIQTQELYEEAAKETVGKLYFAVME